MFGWTTGTVHWGTRQLAAERPRLSIGACVQVPEALCFDPPLLDFYQPLPLVERLRIIARQIDLYARAIDPAWLAWAQGFST